MFIFFLNKNKDNNLTQCKDQQIVGIPDPMDKSVSHLFYHLFFLPSDLLNYIYCPGNITEELERFWESECQNVFRETISCIDFWQKQS